MKKTFVNNLVQGMFWLLIIASILLLSSCSLKTSDPDGVSDPLENPSDSGEASELPALPSDLGNTILLVVRDTGIYYSLSDEDSQYIADLTGNAETHPDIWKSSFGYDFVSETATWSYCTDHGTFSNLSENISINVLSEAEQTRLLEIIMATDTEFDRTHPFSAN